MNQTLETVLQGGALGVLVLVLGGLGYLMLRGLPAASAFLAGLVKEQTANREALAALAAEVRTVNAALTSRIELAETKILALMREHAQEVESTIQRSVTDTGEHAGLVAVNRVVDILQERVSPVPPERETPLPPPAPSRPALRAVHPRRNGDDPSRR